MQKYSNSISASLFWNLLERAGTQGTQLVVSIILARMLLPEAYGILSLVTVFVSIATVFVETGFGSSIIQKKDLTKGQTDVVFTFNFLASLILFAILWVCAPLIATFYSNYDHVLLEKVIRVYALILPAGAVTSIQSAVIYRDMQFRKFFLVNIAVILISSAIGIGLAWAGVGVWALIGQQLSAKLSQLIILLFVVKWKPHLDFRMKKSWDLFKFGSNILLNRLLNVLYNQVSSLVIGKRYSSDMLAFYSKGHTFPSLIATNTDYAMQKVMFSAYSKNQDELPCVKAMMKKTISLSTFLLFPLMFGMFACAENITRVLLTDKWLPCVTYMQIFSLSYMLQPFGTTAAQALNGIGRSDISLKTGVAIKMAGIALIIVAVPLGMPFMAGAVLLTSVISSASYMAVNTKVFAYSLKEQLGDVAANVLTAASMAAVCLLLGHCLHGLRPILILMLQVLSGGIWYIAVSLAVKNKNLFYLIGKLKSILK